MPLKHVACMLFVTTKMPKLKHKKLKILSLRIDFFSNSHKSVEMKTRS